MVDGRGRGPHGEVSDAAALGEHALAQRVDVAVGRLPQAEDGLGRRRAHQGDVVVRRGDQSGGRGGHHERGRGSSRERLAVAQRNLENKTGQKLVPMTLLTSQIQGDFNFQL